MDEINTGAEKWIAINKAMGGQLTMTISTLDGLKTFPVQDVVWTGFPPHKTEEGSAEIKVTMANNLKRGFSPETPIPNPFDRSLISSPAMQGKNPFSERWIEQWQKVTAEAIVGGRQEEPSLHEGLVAFYEPSLSEKKKRSAFLTAVLAATEKQQEGKGMGVEQQMGTWRRAMNDPAEFIKIYFDGLKEEENVNYLFEVFVIALKKQELLGCHYVICCDVPRATAIATLRGGLEEDKLAGVKFHVRKVCEVPAWEG